MDREKQGNRLTDLYILFNKLSINISYFCLRMNLKFQLLVSVNIL